MDIAIAIVLVAIIVFGWALCRAAALADKITREGKGD